MKTVLTKRQAEVLAFITEFIRTKGYSPTLAEIAEGMGLRSIAGVHELVGRLEAAGRIRRENNGVRSIEVVEDEVTAYRRERDALRAACEKVLITAPQRPTYLQPTEHERALAELTNVLATAGWAA